MYLSDKSVGDEIHEGEQRKNDMNEKRKYIQSLTVKKKRISQWKNRMLNAGLNVSHMAS